MLMFLPLSFSVSVYQAMRFHVGCLSSVELASILAKLLRQPDRLRFEPNCSQAEKDERK